MSRFQLILLIVFGAFILLAVLLFAFKRSGPAENGGNLIVWGSVSASDFTQLVAEAKLEGSKLYTFQYKEIPEEKIETEFTEALATGTGPDLVILPAEFIWKTKNKLTPIPYESVSRQVFKSTFVEEGELLMGETGIYGLPLYIDPMVLYWNRDLLSKATFVKPISYWDEIYAASQKLTEKDTQGNILISTIALGETRNIPHYKEILSLLMLQAGTPITAVDSTGLHSFVADPMNLPVAPGNAAVDFYTQFSNPAKPFYLWNRSMLPAQTSFISGDSTMYLGFASELNELKAKNPNLNLGIAQVPQSRVSGKALTYGKLYTLAISRGSKNATAAFGGAFLIVGHDSALILSKILHLPSARRDILSTKPADEALSVFYDAAIQSKGWIDPDQAKSKVVFGSLIDSVTSGRSRTSEAIFKADSDLRAIIEGTK